MEYIQQQQQQKLWPITVSFYLYDWDGFCIKKKVPSVEWDESTTTTITKRKLNKVLVTEFDCLVCGVRVVLPFI